jgi:hypothetical protein
VRRYVVLLFMAPMVTGCNIPPPGYDAPSEPLTFGELEGNWESDTGASLDFNSDRTFNELSAGDVWDFREDEQERVDVAGTWTLCNVPYKETAM